MSVVRFGRKYNDRTVAARMLGYREDRGEDTVRGEKHGVIEEENLFSRNSVARTKRSGDVRI